MSYWQEALLIAGMMAVTLGVRYPVLAMSGHLRMPSILVEALSYVPVAVLSAIVVPMMLAPQNTLFLSLDNEYLIAGLVAIAIAAISHHLLLTITLGMSLFLVLRFFF